MSSSSNRTSLDKGARRIVEAALVLFARHGFQRTSMADVAVEARISRATLYSRFSDKRELFDTIAATLVDDALNAAEAAWVEGATFAENLEASLIAKDLPLYRVLHASPHGAELLALDPALTQDHAQRLDQAFAALLSRRAQDAEASGADLAAFDGPEGFGRFLAIAGAGLKHETRSELEYRAAVRRLCTATARATARDPGPPFGSAEVRAQSRRPG